MNIDDFNIPEDFLVHFNIFKYFEDNNIKDEDEKIKYYITNLKKNIKYNINYNEIFNQS